MTDKYIVHERLTGGRAMHALVVGVGFYPHLIGGNGTLTTSHDGMRAKLSSPPISAVRIAEWLVNEFNNEDYVDSTVSLLLTDADNPTPEFKNNETGVVTPIQAASFDNIMEAVKFWRDRGDINVDDLLLFYFCGHGISEGNAMVILPSDFGSDTDNAYDHAIDFGKLHLGMRQYKANTQCFFIDACRSSSDTLKDNTARQLLQVRPRDIDGVFTAPIYYSSLKGDAAFGRTDDVSIYTSALLKSLSDFAAIDDEGEDDWRVSSLTLSRALAHMVKREYENGAELVQTPITDGNHEDFYLHFLKSPPKANLYVKSQPQGALANAKLLCRANGISVGTREAGEGEEWAVSVPTGSVEVIAEINGEAAQRPAREVFARPIFKRITLDLS